jgi:hypothetical protein
VRDGRLEEHGGGELRVALLRSLGLRDQQLVRLQRIAAADLDMAAQPLGPGDEVGVRGKGDRLVEVGGGLVGLADERGVAPSISRAARGSLSGESCAARAKSRADVACPPRSRASRAAASRADATVSSCATAALARCHAR